MHIAFLVQFSFCKDIVNVPRDDGSVSLKQFCHLALRKPDRILFQPNVEPYRLVRLIHDNLVLAEVYLCARFLFHVILHSLS